MNKRMIYILVIALALVPIIHLVMIYPGLPERIPTHFSMDGKPDDYGSKSTLLFSTALLTLIGLGSFLLVANLHKIDPKKHKNSPGVLMKIGLALMVLFTVIQLLIIDSASSGSIRFSSILLPMLGLFIAYLGNMLNSLKPNYFVGIRTPWALEDEYNWRRTHQLGAKVWFVGGLITVIISLFLAEETGFIVFGIITFILVLIPVVYSFRLYQKSKKQTGQA